MLQKIRSNMQGVVAYFIVGFLVIVFALWGVEAFFSGDGGQDVAEVDGEGITALALSQRVYQQRQQLLAQMGRDVDPSSLDETLLRGPVLQEMIDKLVMEQAALNRGLVVSDALLADIIRQTPEFQVDGVFSPEQFELRVRGIGMSQTQYRDAIKKQILVGQLINGLVLSEFSTEAEMVLAASITGEKRDLAYVLLSPALAADRVHLEADDSKNYYAQHGGEFVTPEVVSVDYITLSLEDFYSPVSDEDIASAYQELLGAVSQVTRRRAAHILLETGEQRSDAEAQQALQGIVSRLEAGESFGVLATEHSDDVGSRLQGGDLGFSDGEAFPDVFEQQLLELASGQVSAPFRSEAGWHIVKLVEVEQNQPPSLAESRDELVNELQRRGAEPRYAVKLESLKDISFNAADLASVAQALDLDVQKSILFGRSGADSGLFANQHLVAEAFSSSVLKDGLNSEVIETAAGEALVLRIDQHMPPAPIPFEEVEESITAQLLAQKQREFLQARADEIQSAAAAGQQLSDLAKRDELDYRELREVTRDNTQGERAEIVTAAFQAGAVTGQANVVVETLADGDVLVLAVTRAVPGSLDELDEEKREAMRQVLVRFQSQRSVAAFRASLNDDAKVKILN